MAFNPSPEVAAARDIAKKFGQNRVIILMLDDEPILQCISYGATKKLCDEAKDLGKVVFDALYDHMWGL